MNNTGQQKLCPMRCGVINEDAIIKKVLKGEEKADPKNMKVEDAFDLDVPPTQNKLVVDGPIEGLPNPDSPENAI